jgi:hypothetical protein
VIECAKKMADSLSNGGFGMASTITLPTASLPEIAALFAVHFDIKKGYQLVWRKAQAGITLDEIVDFKSMPSGLHLASEDLMYVYSI